MNLEKISRVITLTAELITRAEHVETEAEADGSFISGTAATEARVSAGSGPPGFMLARE